MMGRRFCDCISVGLVCLCLGQGVKAPSGNILITVLNAGAGTSSTGSAAMVGSNPWVVNLTSGKLYETPQQVKSIYGELDDHQVRLNRSG
jgi:hypothetical protein